MGKLGYFLSIFTPIFSTASLIVVLTALFTTDWIRTQEKMPNPNYNGTGDKYKSRISKSGLLELCVQNPEDVEMKCKFIEYLGAEEYYPNPNDSTLAIEYTVRQSMFFFVVAVVIQIFGEIGYIYGHYFKDRRMFVFIGGAVFIVSGLVMMIGIVMYISIFKTEVGGKLRPQAPTVPPMLAFQYGCSFVLYICGFLGVELSGTCAVLLFVTENQNSPVFHVSPMPIMYGDYMMSSNPSTNPDVLYPCRIHPQVYVISGMPGDIPSYAYPMKYSTTPKTEKSRKVQRVQNSPPYTPSNRNCEQHNAAEWEYCNHPVEAQRTIGLQVDMVSQMDRFHPENIHCPIDEDINSDYFPLDEFVPFDLERLASPLSVHSGRDSMRKTTLV